MRKTAYTLAFLTISAFVGKANGQDGFSALLADLSFSDLPALNEPLAVAKVERATELKPAPALTMPSNAAPVQKKEAETNFAPPATVALQDPVPAKEPAISSPFDLDAAFELQDLESGRAPAKSVGHILHHSSTSDCGCDTGCDNVITCTPHVKPSLPSSTFQQYFRSNKCAVNVWDGYRQPCGPCQKHIQGRCDCFDKQGNCLSGAYNRSDCVSCDGGCDR
ncbi:MAG: hypothetical protein AB8B91_05135 [Rubripirellula sp.]